MQQSFTIINWKKTTDYNLRDPKNPIKNSTV
jgi:hypothetical protein